MTRAAEFCYIAERVEGVYLMAIWPEDGLIEWTPSTDLALRCTTAGRSQVQEAMIRAKEIAGAHPAAYSVGFRKVLVAIFTSSHPRGRPR